MNPGVPNTIPARVLHDIVVVVDQRAARCTGRGSVGLADRLREAPVDHDGLAELADEDVRRLDVAMDDAALVRVRDRVRRGDDVRQQREPIGELAALADELLERPPRHLAHHVERRAVRRRAGVVHRHDRRMLEPRGDPDLALEPRHRLGIERQRLLERDGAAEHGIGRLDDAAHAAARDLGAHLVAPLGRASRGGATNGSGEPVLVIIVDSSGAAPAAGSDAGRCVSVRGLRPRGICIVPIAGSSGMSGGRDDTAVSCPSSVAFTSALDVGLALASSATAGVCHARAGRRSRLTARTSAHANRRPIAASAIEIGRRTSSRRDARPVISA